MIKPVTSAGQQASAAAAMNEAVVRHGATQESREQRRTERAAEEADSGLPVDQTVIESASEEISTPDGASQRPQSQSEAARGSSARHGAEAAGDHRASDEGLKEQQERVSAQHAAEQHGKRETVRHEGDRHARSTREMMGRVEAKGGPRVGGDVMAAVVGSGAASVDDVAPGSAQAKDSDDDNAQDVQSSREGVEHRHDDARKRVSHERSLGGQTGFHDGDTSHQDSKSGFDERRGGTGQGAGERGGEQSGEQPHRPATQDLTSEAAPSVAAETPSGSDGLAAKPDASAGLLEPAPRLAAPSLGGESAPSSGPADEGETASGSPASHVVWADRSAEGADEGETASGSPASAAAAPSSEVVDTPSPRSASAPDSAAIALRPSPSASSLLGLGDEYFFFDDARPLPEAHEAEAS